MDESHEKRAAAEPPHRAADALPAAHDAAAPAERPAEPVSVVLAEPAPRPAPARPPVQVQVSGCGALAAGATLVLLAAIGAGTLAFFRLTPSVGGAQEAAVNAIGRVYEEGLRPQVTAETVVSTGVSLLTREGKLAVLTRTLPVSVTQRDEKRVLWDSLSLGESVVRLDVRENRVQYVVLLSDLTPERMAYDAGANTLRVTLEAPRVDRDLIEVSSDPAHWQVYNDAGYARIEHWFGREMLERAQGELRGALYDAAMRDTAALEAAREAARQQVGQLLRAALDAAAPGIAVEITFREPLG